jgi:hypothetical protein
MNFKILGKARHWWLVLVIPTTWEAELGGSRFKTSSG